MNLIKKIREFKIRFFTGEYRGNDIDGWMSTGELKYLYSLAKEHLFIGEVGSWKGRSTHALCRGNKGAVVAIDTFIGSGDLRDGTAKIASTQNIFQEFSYNLKEFNNLGFLKTNSIEASKYYSDEIFDMVFIDGDHSYGAVKADNEHWWPKVKTGGILCGHDYNFDEVKRAVDEKFGKPDLVTFSIWIKYKK